MGLHRTRARGVVRGAVRGVARGRGGTQPGTGAGADAEGDAGVDAGTDAGADAGAAADVVGDRTWAGEVRAAVFCALTLFVLVLIVDGANTTLTWPRAALWAGLSAVLYVVLHPARVTAGPGWLAVRRLLRTRRVCTGLLTAVRLDGGVAARLVLRDSLGNRVELDPKVLTDNPLLLHRLDRGARDAQARGLLRTGVTVLHRFTDRADAEAARAVFEASGLTPGLTGESARDS
ncbi:hypothetical protein [Streptomyces sp. NPDC059009]|uniref:hypothetical protein n=1 Tax=Streptomyces sp. NPDC059009 TaxID=3346694 RepID=UPI0036B9FAAE